jgi:hypothetical protein
MTTHAFTAGAAFALECWFPSDDGHHWLYLLSKNIVAIYGIQSFTYRAHIFYVFFLYNPDHIHCHRVNPICS